MTVKANLKTVSDDELLRGLFEILKDSRRAEADLVAHIAEIDARRLYARQAASSMFAYCTEVLHLSEAEAWIRIRVARASRTHPMLLTMLRDGRLHLSGIVVMAPHLTLDNREALLKRATHQPKRRIEELVAELTPQEDAPAGMRREVGVVSVSASPFRGAFVFAKRFASSRSSFSVKASWMIFAISPSGTEERMSACSRSIVSWSSALAVNWTLKRAGARGCSVAGGNCRATVSRRSTESGPPTVSGLSWRTGSGAVCPRRVGSFRMTVGASSRGASSATSSSICRLVLCEARFRSASRLSGVR